MRRLTPAAERLLLLTIALYMLGVTITLFDLGSGIRLLGLGLLLMAGWLWRYDIARRTILQTGLPRYIAACLLLGYLWLGIGGIIGIWKGALYAGADYAALLHALLLGFVFSMIFGHMPIILPALTGLRISYQPILYAPLILLHSTLLYRLYGYLSVDALAQRWSGLFNVLVILLFLAVMLFTVLRSNIQRRPAAPLH